MRIYWLRRRADATIKFRDFSSLHDIAFLFAMPEEDAAQPRVARMLRDIFRGFEYSSLGDGMSAASLASLHWRLMIDFALSFHYTRRSYGSKL